MRTRRGCGGPGAIPEEVASWSSLEDGGRSRGSGKDSRDGSGRHRARGI